MYGTTFGSGISRYPSSCFAVTAELATADWTLHSGWLDAINGSYWRDLLEQRIAWEQPVVQVYGRRHPVPRLTMFLAETGVSYRYSGTVHHGEGWPDWFEPLLDRIIQTCDARFNGCLLNLYRNGEDRMGWHADDEPEIDQQQPIASLSLGASRDFQLRERSEPKRKVSLSLGDGDLLVMHPGCQQRWIHAVPVRRRLLNARINLTFRCFQGR